MILLQTLILERENIFYRGENDSGERIKEPFTAAKELGVIFASESLRHAKLYGHKITKFTALPGAKILRYDTPEFWRILRRRRPPNNWIGSVTKIGKENLVDIVNLLTRLAHKQGYDAIVFSPTDHIGTMIFNLNAFEKTNASLMCENRFPAIKTKSGKVFIGRIHADAVSKTDEDLESVGWWSDGKYYTEEEARKIWGKASTDALEPNLHRAWRLNQQMPEIPNTPVNV